MSLLQPNHQEPFVVPANDAVAYLAQMGIDVSRVHDALSAGEVAAGNTRRSAPVTAAGSRRWFSTTEEFRDYLSTENAWDLSDPNNRPLATSPDERYTLGIVGGNEATGNPDPAVAPKAHRKKGRATEEAVNQPTLFELERPSKNPLSLVAAVTPPPGGWFLLYYRAEDEIRCEVSLPAPDFQDGQFGSWLVRVILHAIPITATTNKITDIGGGDIDFLIA